MQRICFVLAIAIISVSCTTTAVKVPPQVQTRKYACPGHPEANEGKVALLIDVNSNGKAENIRIVESEPKGVFDDTATCIAQQAIFSKSKDGQLPPFKNHRAEYEFKIPANPEIRPIKRGDDK